MEQRQHRCPRVSHTHVMRVTAWHFLRLLHKQRVPLVRACACWAKSRLRGSSFASQGPPRQAQPLAASSEQIVRVQGAGEALRAQLRAIEEDISVLSRAARAAGPTALRGPMALVLERRKPAPALGPELDLSASPLPPFEHGAGDLTPEGSGYEVLLQVPSSPDRFSAPHEVQRPACAAVAHLHALLPACSWPPAGGRLC